MTDIKMIWHGRVEIVRIIGSSFHSCIGINSAINHKVIVFGDTKDNVRKFFFNIFLKRNIMKNVQIDFYGILNRTKNGRVTSYDAFDYFVVERNWVDNIYDGHILLRKKKIKLLRCEIAWESFFWLAYLPHTRNSKTE